MAMTAEQAEHSIGAMVMVGSRDSGRPHAAKLLSVRGDTAEVQPGGHKHAEKVPLSKLRLWAKGNEEMIAIREVRNRLHGRTETRAVEPGNPNFVNARELLAIAKREDLAITSVYNWIHGGLIPEDATFKSPTGARLFDVHQLRAAGFFDKIKRCVSKRRREPLRDGRPAGVRPEVWEKPAPPVVAPATVAEKAPSPALAPAITVSAAPPLVVAPRPEMSTAKQKLAHAMRDRATAESILHEARAREALALVELEIARLEAAP